MNDGASQRGLSAYRQVGVEASVADASPHQLVQMMLDGALARIAAARGAIGAGDVALKGEMIAKAIGLVEGLRVSLDQDKGGELASNLAALYEYMGRRLLEANVHTSIDILEEVAGLLRELQSGWREIGRVQAPAEPTASGASSASGQAAKVAQ